MDRLAEYRGKRDPARTPEPVPEGEPDGTGGQAGIFVVQEHHARRLHWDFRLERGGVLVSWALPKGVPDDPAQNHLAVHTEDHPLEYATFHGQIPRGEYGGGSVTIWDHGTYEVLKWTDREVKVILHGERLHGGYVLFATGGKDDKNWMIHRERLPLPATLAPMLATIGKPPARGLAEWAVEMKWDGVRAIAFIENGRLRLGSRTGKDITATYPELAGMARAAASGHKQALLDGEIVAFSDGRPDFEALQPRMHVSSRRAGRPAGGAHARHVSRVRRAATGRALTHRASLLGAACAAQFLFPERKRLALPAQFPRRGPGRRAHRLRGERSRRRGGEAARLRYEPGARTGSWLKIKNQLRQEVVVAGWKPGKGNRTGLIGSLLVGVQDDAGPAVLRARGHRVLRRHAAHAEPQAGAAAPQGQPVRPAGACRGCRNTVWVEPRLVAEVAFDRWTREGRLRAPVYQGLRDDKDPADVVRET